MKNVIIKNRTFNAKLLYEEVAAAFGAIPFNMNLAGFERSGDRTFSPSAGPRVISIVNGVKDEAQPGEIWIHTKTALKATQITQLGSLFDAHDENGTTASQAEEDKDETALNKLAVGVLSLQPAAAQKEMLDQMQRLILRKFNRTP